MSGAPPFGPNQSAPLTGVRLADEEPEEATAATTPVDTEAGASGSHQAPGPSRYGDAPAFTPANAATTQSSATPLPAGEVLAVIDNGNDDNFYKATVDGISHLTSSSYSSEPPRGDPLRRDPPASDPPASHAGVIRQSTSPRRDDRPHLDIEQGEAEQERPSDMLAGSAGVSPNRSPEGSASSPPDNSVNGDESTPAAERYGSPAAEEDESGESLKGSTLQPLAFYRKSIIAVLICISISIAIIVGAVCGSGNCGGGSEGRTSSNANDVVSYRTWTAQIVSMVPRYV